MKQEIKDFIHLKVSEMRSSVIKSVGSFELKKLLINPYLAATFYNDPSDFIRTSLQASLYRTVQTKFGNLLEEISIKVCGDNVKSSSDGIDLDFLRNKRRLLISIKSGTTWGNGQSTKKQGEQFKKAKNTIKKNDKSHEITSVMGICCSKRKTIDNFGYADYQICGQNYWCFISGEKDFYREMISEMKIGVREFDALCKMKINETAYRLIQEFHNEYDAGSSLWEEVVCKSCGNFSEEETWLNDIGSKMKFENKVGDCVEVLKQLDKRSVDLVITSPPYADARKKLYGGPSPDKYVEWFLPISECIKDVLKPNGTFVLNIKEKVVKGERHTYVIELILALKKQGWLWTEEWGWHKLNCFPGKWTNRFRDAWERCLQFNLQKTFKMNQDSVRVPVGDWAKKRLKYLSGTDKKRNDSDSGSPFGKNVSNWVGRDLVYPTNVIYLATECGNKQHSAVFPKELPSFFIKLFTDEGDLVLDPFEGSGTTGVAAVELKRNYIGIDVNEEYSKKAQERIINAVNDKKAQE